MRKMSLQWKVYGKLFGFGARVHFTNRCHCAQFNEATEKASRYVRTTRYVADVFGEFFFATVRIAEASVYRNTRHGRGPSVTLIMIGNRGVPASNFRHPGG